MFPPTKQLNVCQNHAFYVGKSEVNILMVPGCLKLNGNVSVCFSVIQFSVYTLFSDF